MGVLIICKVVIHEPINKFKEARGLTLNIHPIFNLDYSFNLSFFIPIFSPKANMGFVFGIKHIAICMCNSLKSV